MHRLLGHAAGVAIAVAAIANNAGAQDAPGSQIRSDDTLPTQNIVSGHVSTGIELRRGRPALRFEVRDYVSAFRSPLGKKRSARDDVMPSVSIAYGIW